MKKFFAIICFLFLVIAFIPTNNINGETSIETVDYSIPVRDNSLKKYESNIPDIWYDLDRFCGAYNGDPNSTSVDNDYGALDLISIDGTTNYANIDILEIPLNETIEFYMEFGYVNWGQGVPLESLYVTNYTQNVDIVITSQYGENNYTYFESKKVDSSTQEVTYDYIYSTDSSVPPGYVYPYLYENEVMSYNEDYHLPKMSLTAVKTGFSVLNIVFSDGKSGGVSAEKTLVIHVMDTTNESCMTRELEFKSGTSNIVESKSLTETFYLPFSYENYYSYYTNSSFDYPETQLSTNVSLNSSDPNVENLNNNVIHFREPGRYFVEVEVDVYIYCPINVVEESGVTNFNYDQYNFKENYTVEVVVYDLNEIEFLYNGNVFENELYIVQSSSGVLEMNLPHEEFTLNYTLDNEAFDCDLSTLTNGIYTVKCDLTDDKFQAFLSTLDPTVQELFSANITKEILIIVDVEENIYPNIIVDYDNLVLTLKELNNVNSIKIMNYNNIINFGNITVIAPEGFEYGFEDGNITIGSNLVGKYNLKIKAEYPHKTFEKDIDVVIINDYEFVTNKSILNLDLNSSDFFDIGYIVDEEFFNINTISDFSYDVISSSTNVEIINGTSITIKSLDKTGVAVISIIIFHQEQILEVLTVDVIIEDSSSDDVNEDTEIHFVEGDLVRLLLSDKTNSIKLTLDPIVAGKGSDFTWLSLNARVATITKISETEALLVGVSVGTTDIIAIYQHPNGQTLTAKCSVIVFDQMPTITIDFTNEGNDNLVFTIYDEILVSLNSNGFNFSNNVSIKWYINDQLINSALDNLGNVINLTADSFDFYYKFTEGISEVRVELIDEEYDLILSTKRDISVSKEENQERVLSFIYDQINLILSGEQFRLAVLMDGVVNQDYEYKWSIDNTKVASIYMTENNEAIIVPKGVGQTILNVFTNIGKYEEMIVRAEIVINVEELLSVNLSAKNEFNKPGDEISISILINDEKKFMNFTPKIEILNGEEIVDYEYVDGEIIINAAPAGKLNINVSVEEISTRLSLNVTNFNIKELVIILLPYLCIGFVVAILVFIIFKVNSDPFKNAIRAIDRLLKGVDKGLIKLDAANDEKTLKLVCKNLLKQSNRLCKTLIYYTDEGIDEFKHPTMTLINIISILKALLKTENIKKINGVAIINSLYDNHIKVLSENINEIIDSRRKHEETVRQNMIEEKKEKQKSKPQTDYENVLKQYGFTNVDDEVDE